MLNIDNGLERPQHDKISGPRQIIDRVKLVLILYYE